MILVLQLAAALALSGRDSLTAAIEARIAQDSGVQVAVAYTDRSRHDSLYLRADTAFHAASTMKLPVMMELFRQVDAKSFGLDQGILLVNKFASIADGSSFSVTRSDDADTTMHDKAGTRVSVREMLNRMIDRSSNLATNQLIAMIGPPAVNAMMQRLGARRMKVLRGVEDIKAFDAGMNNVATARDLAILLDAIQNSRPEIGSHRREMLDILLAQEFNDGIPAGLPAGTRVAHKTGEITSHSHDAAIIYPRGRDPYILVVLTRGIQDSTRSDRLISDISRIIYLHATR